MRDNLGDFIKEQRHKNGISQNKLAEILFIDRTLISKWENNKATPCMNEIVKMAALFHISVEEFIYGEEYNKNNKKDIQNNFNEYLVSQDNKLIKFKKIVQVSIFTILSFLLAFFGYYFYNTYNKTIVYRVTGESSNYIFNDGLLLLTRNKSYLKISKFDPNINYVTIYLKDNNRIIYEGTLGINKIDYNGYDSSINLKNIKKLSNDIYMDIYDNDGNKETIKLEIRRDYISNSILFEDENKYIDGNNKVLENSIPIRIKNIFNCNDIVCNYKKDNLNFDYDLKLKFLYISFNDVKISFNTNNNEFVYKDNSQSFVVNEKLFVSDNNKQIYYFYKKYIDYYIYNKGSE